MTDAHRENEVIHRLRNHLAVIVSFAEILLTELAPEDEHRMDIVEVNKAARAAMDLMPQLAQLASSATRNP